MVVYVFCFLVYCVHAVVVCVSLFICFPFLVVIMLLLWLFMFVCLLLNIVFILWLFVFVYLFTPPGCYCADNVAVYGLFVAFLIGFCNI